jgi:hypothetical membrane protein
VLVSGEEEIMKHKLLACGVLAGPLFFAVSLAQAFTRDWFDPTYHPISLLSLGDLGWIQIANFIVTGALLIACAVGMWRVLHPGRAGTWGPILVAASGIGLIVAGVFVSDAGAGFPPGTPDGPPEHFSWHGILHEVGFAVTTLSWLAACFVFRRRFAALGQRGWARACVAAPVAVIVVMAWPDVDSLSVRLAVGSAILFGFVAAVAVHLLRGLRDPARPSGHRAAYAAATQ